MRVKVDLQKSVFTPSGSLRYIEGDYDGVNGVVWLDPVQQGNRKVRPGMGIHLASRTAIERTEPPPAHVEDAPFRRGPGRPPKVRDDESAA